MKRKEESKRIVTRKKKEGQNRMKTITLGREKKTQAKLP